MTIESIRLEANKLPLEERETLVRMLERDLEIHGHSSNEETDPLEVESEWDELIAERAREVEVGAIDLIPYDDVEAEMDKFVEGLAQK